LKKGDQAKCAGQPYFAEVKPQQEEFKANLAPRINTKMHLFLAFQKLQTGRQMHSPNSFAIKGRKN
jgi:hypothetical protein